MLEAVVETYKHQKGAWTHRCAEGGSGPVPEKPVTSFRNRGRDGEACRKRENFPIVISPTKKTDLKRANDSAECGK